MTLEETEDDLQTRNITNTVRNTHPHTHTAMNESTFKTYLIINLKFDKGKITALANLENHFERYPNHFTVSPTKTLKRLLFLVDWHKTTTLNPTVFVIAKEHGR